MIVVILDLWRNVYASDLKSLALCGLWGRVPPGLPIFMLIYGSSHMTRDEYKLNPKHCIQCGVIPNLCKLIDVCIDDVNESNIGDVFSRICNKLKSMYLGDQISVIFYVMIVKLNLEQIKKQINYLYYMHVNL